MVMDFGLLRHFWQISPVAGIFPCHPDRPTIPKGRTYVANWELIKIWIGPPYPPKIVCLFALQKLK